MVTALRRSPRVFGVFDDNATSKPSKKTKGTKPKKQKQVDNGVPATSDKDVVDDISSKENEQQGTKRKKGEGSGSEEDDDDDIDTSLKKTKLSSSVDDEQSLIDSIPKVKTFELDAIEGCVHEVAVPDDPDYTYSNLTPSGALPAKDYPFVLDPFQKEALKCLDNNQSVLVSAHTSAGKTVVAEYAIAMSLRDKQRVIYTTPIKALSNQKYRELSDEFHDVGLMTGDTTINPSASCIIMTTEILRSMLYRGSEIVREVAWVVFDEIHYMRDKERGVVWEETIILLPDNVHFVFLSATIPNAKQFAEWICHLHKQPCHVVYTDYRPVPLQHYMYPAGGDGIQLVVDEKSVFREDNFLAAMQVLQNAGDAAKGDTKGRKGGTSGPSNIFKIVKMIMERNFQPTIIFSFSKKECEAYALQMAKLDFNTEEEKKLCDEVFNNAIDCLSDVDKKLPQVENLLPLLRQGIAIHHSGLLPILKETIEILFSEGLIKALFATETFAMGLNMPARTVVFTKCQKFDGKEFRWLTSGEYIQMSGRAGRRGLDERGIVILMVDEKMSPAIGKDLLQGSADALNSAFHLTYNMVLNLLRVEEINPEYMLEKSFYQFQNRLSVPGMMDKLKKLEKQWTMVEIPDEDSAMTYYKIQQQLMKLGKDLQKFITLPKYALPFMQPGRLVHVVNVDDDFGWGVVINFQKKANQGKITTEADTLYVVETLLLCSKDSVKNAPSQPPKPCKKGDKGEMMVVPVMLHLITQISSVRLYIPKDLRPIDNRQSVYKSLQEVERRFPDGLPHLDPVDDMAIKNNDLKKTIKKIETLESKLYAHKLHRSKDLLPVFDQCEKKAQLATEVKDCKRELKKMKTLLQMDELKCRKRVLRRLGYATASDVIELKGRVSCEISCADELVLTEMIFSGTFNDMTPAQITALMSCFVFQEKSNESPKLNHELATAYRKLQDTARRIAQVSVEAKLEIDEQDYVDSFKPQMVEVVFEWCNGAPFVKICQMTDIFEGSIIRCMRRLEELLREMCKAAKAIGNNDLEKKFLEGITLIKRDIVFAASLYL